MVLILLISFYLRGEDFYCLQYKLGGGTIKRERERERERENGALCVKDMERIGHHGDRDGADLGKTLTHIAAKIGIPVFLFFSRFGLVGFGRWVLVFFVPSCVDFLFLGCCFPFASGFDTTRLFDHRVIGYRCDETFSSSLICWQCQWDM